MPPSVTPSINFERLNYTDIFASTGHMPKKSVVGFTAYGESSIEVESNKPLALILQLFFFIQLIIIFLYGIGEVIGKGYNSSSLRAGGRTTSSGK